MVCAVYHAGAGNNRCKEDVEISDQARSLLANELWESLGLPRTTRNTSVDMAKDSE